MRFFGITFGLFAILGVFVNLSGWGESTFFYYPVREPFPTPAEYEDVTFKTEDGLTLHGWFIPASGWKAGDPPSPAILHVHGNAGNVSMHDGFTTFLPKAGFAVLLFDYRSFGRSERGRMVRWNMVKDTRAALAYLRSRDDVDSDRIAIFGQSIGATFAAAVAGEDEDVKALLSVSGFSSWRGIATTHASVLGWLLMRPGLDAEDSVKRLGNRPLMIVHGNDDKVVPVRHGKGLEKAAEEAGVSVETVYAERRNHINILDGPLAQKPIIAFFRRALGD